MKKLINIIVFLSAILSSTHIWAQGPPPPPANTPLDSGILLLIGATVGLGVKKLNDRVKQNKSE
jgi:hypothetical protein